MNRMPKECRVETTIGNDGSRERKSVWRFVAKAVVSLVLLWLPLRHADFSTVLTQIVAVDWEALLYALLILAAATLVAALRWSIILRALAMSRGLRVTYPLSLIGLFFGQALPAGVGGDVVRIWLGCKTGLSTRAAISSILGDRLIGLVTILLMVTVELPALRNIAPTLCYVLLALLATGYAGFAVIMLLDKLPAALHRFRVVRGFAGISADLRATLLSPRAGVPALVCSTLIQLGNVFAVFALARGLDLPTDLASCLLIVPLANLLQSLPISIAGWGVRESFFVAAFGMVGVGAPQAMAVSVDFGLLIIVSSLPGGVLWLLQGAGYSQKLRDALSARPAVSGE